MCLLSRIYRLGNTFPHSEVHHRLRGYLPHGCESFCLQSAKHNYLDIPYVHAAGLPYDLRQDVRFQRNYRYEILRYKLLSHCRPAVVLGLVVSLFAIWFNEEIVPRANNAYDNTVQYEIKGNTAPASQEHIIIKEVNSSLIKRIIYARRYDSKTKRMEHITMQMFEEGKLKNVENAAYADWLGDSWLMHDGVIYEVQDGNVKAHNSRFDTQLLPVNMSPRKIMESQKKMEEMTRSELREQIKILQEQYVDTKKLEAELAQRYTVPMASLIFAMIGVPLGMQPNRRSSSAGFALSVIIIFIYYAGMVMATAFGRGGALPPMLAVWLPNIISGAVGLYLVRKAAR